MHSCLVQPGKPVTAAPTAGCPCARDGESKTAGRGSGPLAEAAEGCDERAQQDEQRDADAADADRLEEPTGVGGQPGVGGKEEQAADQPGGRAHAGDAQVGGELVDEAAVSVGGE